MLSCTYILLSKIVIGVLPKLSSRNTKLDKDSKKDILTRCYDIPQNISFDTSLEILEILKTRQEHIRREVNC
jgi:hypothetical protein